MSDDENPPKRDIALLCGPAPGGDGIQVLRAREGRLEAGVVREMREGRPLHGGEIVKLVPREGSPRVCDVEVQASLPGSAEPPRTGDGPAQVATDSYRRNWDRIFGEPAPEAAADRTLN